jgi:hypothetical protein
MVVILNREHNRKINLAANTGQTRGENANM